MNDNPHEDLEFSCPTEIGTKTQEVPINRNETEEKEVPDYCGTTLTYDDNYVGLSNVTEARREGYEHKALKFRCPDCGETTLRCPVCADSDTPGYFRGESTGKMLACHNCNQAESQRQKRGRF